MKAIGIDIGTSGCKGVLVSFPDGAVLKSARRSYTLHAEGNRAEHEPEDWVTAVTGILEELGPADAIGMDGMMHSEVCIGADGKATVGLAELDVSHAFANIALTDNVVRFATRRYRDNPLIVQGPGAGPEVTAGGVFADLLRLAAYLGARL